jgi:hypothetical protein
MVFELGFSFVILQMASHERAHLTFSADGTIAGDLIAHARLASVLQKAVRWYAIAALFFVGIALPVGFLFFNTYRHAGPPISFSLPWCMVVFAATLTFLLDPVLSFLEGCGYVARVATLRFVQAISGSLLAWAALLAHHGLFAPALMILGQGVTALIWLSGKRVLLISLFTHCSGGNHIQWRTEVWPFQWRIAVSWICGYFMLQFFTPVLFAYRGPAEAAQMGMSISIAGALTAVCISWVNTKAAPFGNMIARRQYAELDRTFFSALRQSLCVCICGIVAIWAGVMYLNAIGSPYAKRVLGPGSFGILLLATAVNHIWFSEAIYLRAHKQEKFLVISVSTAVLIALSTFMFGRRMGASGILAGYLAVSTVVGLVFGSMIFLRYRRVWHLN